MSYPLRAYAVLLTTLVAALSAAGCGAKTGLRLPDVIIDVPDVFDVPDIVDVTDVTDVPDVQDVQDACVPGMFALFRREAMAMFVIDRSSSMRFNLDGTTDPPRRWDVLHDALAATLPRYELEIQMGAVYFPQEDNGDPSIEAQCSANTNMIDVLPAYSRAQPIIHVLETTNPYGGTPTFEALAQAGDALVTLGTRATGHYIVLATDGGPNCNLDIDPTGCTCTSGGDAGTDCPPYNCLDRQRTLDVIDATLNAKHIPVYVIGIADQTRPDLQMVLAEMAEHGGRPNRQPGQPPYYSVQSSQDLVGAFTAIEQEIARCAFVTPSRPDDPNGLELSVAGVPTPRDPTHMDGWDWTDETFGEITLYGPACARALAVNTTDAVVATVGCHDGP